MKKVVAYCRVSTDKFDQLNSFENQKQYFESLLNKEDGYDLVEIFADKGLSGTQFKNRTEFNRMMQMAGLDIDIINKKYIYTANKLTEPMFNYIYVTNTSRFARNVEVISIIRALKDKGVYVVFNDLGKSTENPEDEMILQLFFTMDEQESKDKSMKVTNGYKRSAVRTDKIHTNSKIYGYKFLRDENRLEIIPNEAEVVKVIFQLTNEGLGQRRIIKELDDRGIKTRKGKSFSTNTINYILRNIKYCGVSDRLKFSTPKLFSNAKVKRNSNEDIIFKETNKIPSIISREEFDKAQQIREERTIKDGNGVYYGSNPFANKIKCMCCGANYSSNIDRGRRFYNCTTKKTKGTEYCSNKNISLAKLEEIIEQNRGSFYIYICTQFQTIKQAIENKINEYNELIENEDIIATISNVKNQIESINFKKAKLLDLYLDDKLDKVMFEDKQTKFEEELETLNIELENLNNGESQYIILRDELVSLRNEIEVQIKNKKGISAERFIDEIDYISVDGEDVKIVTVLEKMIEEVKEFIELV